VRTGTPSFTTGFYVSDCACASKVEVSRADIAPPCPKCRRPVDWSLLRSTYRPALGDESEFRDGPALPWGGSGTQTS
jgi:hypothetical protein